MVYFRTSRSQASPGTIHFIGKSPDTHYDIVVKTENEENEQYIVKFNHEIIAVVTDYYVAEGVIYRHAADLPCFEPLGGLYYVNEYLVDQAYGGPEEGGWWFECGTFVRCIGKYGDENLARRIQKGWQKTLDLEVNNGRPSISSVLSEGLYTVRLENNTGQDYPQHMPHYE